MKNKLQVSNKVQLKQRWLYATLGLGTIALISTFILIYFSLGKPEKAAASGEGNSCVLTVNSTKGYSVRITVVPIRFVDVVCYSESYNHRIQFQYEIEYSGTGAPIFYDLRGNYTYEGVTYEFPMNIRSEGIHTTHSYIYKTEKHCSTADLSKVDNIRIYINTDGISPQTIQCSEILLPISLLDFDARRQKDGIFLQWTTASELNNDFFTLERSSDGKNFETIATIDGAGDSNVKQAYQFLDRNPAPGNNFYRLKQTDFDGKFEYFKILLVNNSGKPTSTDNHHELKIQEVYPNPFADEANFKFEAGYEGLVELKIHNIQGESVYNETIACSPGMNYHTFSNIAHLQSGVYFFTFQNDAYSTKPQRLVKL